MICLNGQGGFTDVSVRNRPQLHSRPLLFTSLRTKDWVRVVDAPVPDHLIATPTDRKWDSRGQGYSNLAGMIGSPHFASGKVQAQFPFCHVDLTDPDIH